MSNVYEEVEIEDLLYDSNKQLYTYPCPCGDTFRITLEELWDGEDIAKCPSCTLQILIIFEELDLPPLRESDGDDEDQADTGKAQARDDGPSRLEHIKSSGNLSISEQLQTISITK
jgi:diphthamide biosynthesis protein 3